MRKMITMRDRVVSEQMARAERIRKNWLAFKRLQYGQSFYKFPTLDETSERFFYKLVPDRSWKGSRCFIIGGGPSLKDFDFSRLRGELTIGINRAYERFDCTILFSMDAQYLRWILTDKINAQAKTKFGDFKGYRVWTFTEKWDYPQGVYLINTLGGYQISYSMEMGLGTGANSGFSALNLAICLGANPIYLLGFDMKGENGKQAWWHDGYPNKQPEKVYERFRADFGKIAPELEMKKIRVVNLNRQSAMKCFEFGDFEDIKPFRLPVFISYYTKNTGYEEEAKRLIGSLRRFNLEHDVEGVPNLGSWQKNTQYKAEFIKRMLLKHKRAVVFIDADAMLRSYPFLFRDFDADVAAHLRDYAQFPISRRHEGKELLSGTLYIDYNERTLPLVDKWIALNRQNPTVWEQKNLQAALEDFEGEFKELPAEYCKIYDTMKVIQNPVVEHFQASRRLRHEVNQ